MQSMYATYLLGIYGTCIFLILSNFVNCEAVRLLPIGGAAKTTERILRNYGIPKFRMITKRVSSRCYPFRKLESGRLGKGIRKDLTFL